MKYRYFIINQIFGYEKGTDYIDFFIAISKYVNPEITMYGYMEYASNYMVIFNTLINELMPGGGYVEVLPSGQYDEIDKYDLLFIVNGQKVGRSSYTHGKNGSIWTISLNGKFKSISTKNWDEIINFIRDNI